MSTAAIRAFGVFTFVFEAFILFAFMSQGARLGPLTLPALIYISFLCFVVTLIGVGLLFLRKWAAIFFSLALVILPTWFTLDAIGESPAGFFVMMLAVAIVLILPIVIIIRSWGLLSWRGRWLF
jgi:hypothetical protein